MNGYGSQWTPTEIRHITQENCLEVDWETGEQFRCSVELLRIACPCADCRGHTPDQRKIVDGKRDVTLASIEPVGHYAVKLTFSDGHDTGVYSWDTLHQLGADQSFYWGEYLELLEKSGKTRELCTLDKRHTSCS